MVVRQGDVFWIQFGEPRGSAPAYRRPAVVVQCNRFNDSAIQTVVVCPVTSSMQRSGAPGNVLLSRGEANLPRRSIVVVSGIMSVDRSELQEKLGTLSRDRIREILAGVFLVLQPP